MGICWPVIVYHGYDDTSMGTGSVNTTVLSRMGGAEVLDGVPESLVFSLTRYADYSI